MSHTISKGGLPSRSVRWRAAAGGLCAAVLVAAAGLKAEDVILSDIIAGGDGRGTAPPENVGINADTGLFETTHNNADITNSGDNPQEVFDSEFIDSVFVMNLDNLPIHTGGARFFFDFGDANGSTWNHIIKDVTHDIDKGIDAIWAGGINTFESAVSIHASAGITFDLEALRDEYGPENVRWFQAFFGADQCNGLIKLYAIVSDEEAILDSVKVGPIAGNGGQFAFIGIPDEALFLTLAVGDANNGIGCDHGVFAEAIVTPFLQFPPERDVSTPGDPAACPIEGGGPVDVTISQQLTEGTDPAAAVTVVEKVLGSITTAEVSAAGATVEDTFPNGFTNQGFIHTWLLLGPYVQPDTNAPFNAPGEDNIRLDYLTDGVDVTELDIEPESGDEVETDFFGAAASAGLAVSNGINPGGVPTWHTWVDLDDTINFNDYYGGDVNNIMMYAAVYFALDKATELNVGLASDDAVQVLLNGAEVHINNIARGAGGNNTVQDTVPLGELTEGVHLLMVKVFEGGGGHGFRVRFQDPFTGDPVTEGITICLSQDLPCVWQPHGVQITWNTTLGALEKGLDYQVALDNGLLNFRGNVGGRTILGNGSFRVLPTPEDFGPFADPSFEHAHSIGAPCPGTGVTSPSAGTIEIAGAGEDIWQNGDQFVFAYSAVTGDFSARANIIDRQFAPGSRWGKHGIMARQDCSTRSRYTFIHDQGEDLQDTTRLAHRPTHGGADNFEITPAAAGVHADTLRLDRCGSEFIAYVYDAFGDFGGTPDAWYEVGRVDWGPEAPETVQLGLAVTSHQGCDVTTITFEDWEVLPGCIGPVQNLSCELSKSALELAWENASGADPAVDIAISVNGSQVETVAGNATSASVPLAELDQGILSIEVVNSSGIPARCGVLNDVEIFINAGGPRLDPSAGTGIGDGRVWEEDTFQIPSPFLLSPNNNTADFSVGGFAPPIAVADTTLVEPEFVDDPARSRLFATERWDTSDVVYRVALIPGTYDVTLLFAEGCCSGGCEDIPDPALSAGGCRVFDIYVNGNLVEDQFAQHVEAQRALGNALPNSNWGVALAKGPYTVSGSVIEIRIADLGGTNPPENASIKGIAIVPSDVSLEICDNGIDDDGDTFADCEDDDCRDAPECKGGGFVRGDVDASGIINITDAVFLLNFLFAGGPTPPCVDAADVDNAGANLPNITDAVFLLNWLFQGGPEPPAPSPGTAAYSQDACGPDPEGDADGISCDAFAPCT